MPVGLDVGTSYICASRAENNKVTTVSHRDAFLSLPLSKENQLVLDRVGTPYIKLGKKYLLVLGEDAISFANVFKQEPRRPMRLGVVSNRDPLAKEVLSRIVRALVGDAKKTKEICCYTVPGQPIDISPEDFDITYHELTIGEILTNAGYTTVPVNEASCIIYDSLEDTQFTGIAMSWGAGQVNVCLSKFGVTKIGDLNAAFSVAKSGDWIDRKVSQIRMGMTSAQVIRIKENKEDPVNIIKDNGSKDPIRDGLAKICTALIKEILINTARRFGQLDLGDTEGMPLIVAGGTSLIGGFIDVFKKTLDEIEFPIKITEIRHAQHPLESVSRGALVRAMMEEA